MQYTPQVLGEAPAAPQPKKTIATIPYMDHGFDAIAKEIARLRGKFPQLDTMVLKNSQDDNQTGAIAKPFVRTDAEGNPVGLSSKSIIEASLSHLSKILVVPYDREAQGDQEPPEASEDDPNAVSLAAFDEELFANPPETIVEAFVKMRDLLPKALEKHRFVGRVDMTSFFVELRTLALVVECIEEEDVNKLREISTAPGVGLYLDTRPPITEEEIAFGKKCLEETQAWVNAAKLAVSEDEEKPFSEVLGTEKVEKAHNAMELVSLISDYEKENEEEAKRVFGFCEELAKTVSLNEFAKHMTNKLIGFLITTAPTTSAAAAVTEPSYDPEEVKKAIETSQGTVTMPGSNAKNFTRELTVIQLDTAEAFHPRPREYAGATSVAGVAKRHRRNLETDLERAKKAVSQLDDRNKPSVVQSVSFLRQCIYFALAHKVSERVEYKLEWQKFPMKYDPCETVRGFILDHADFLQVIAPYLKVEGPPADSNYAIKQAVGDEPLPEFFENPDDAERKLADSQNPDIITDVDFKEV